MTTSPPFPSITKKWHNTSYPAIDPKRPELSAKGKSILITGGGTGIGAAIATSFATAGVREVALLGRTQRTLSAAADSLKKDFSGIKVLTIITDVTDESSVNAAFDQTVKAFGKIDICVSNAGYTSTPGPIATADTGDWLQSFETNVKGSFLVSRAFLKTAKQGSFLLHTGSGMSHMPSLGNTSSYAASKAAANYVFGSVAVENPGIHVVNVQPGVVATDISRKGSGWDFDDADLAGNFYVWLTSPEAAFLKSKFVWVNWDAEELKAMKDRIEKEELLELGMKGLSFNGWDVSAIVAEHNRA